MKNTKNNTYRAINHIFGQHLFFVVFLLLLFGWLGDLLLELFTTLSVNVLKTEAIYVKIYLLSSILIVLIIIYSFSRFRKTSDRYQIDDIDRNVLDKKTLILALSPFSSRYKTEDNERIDIETFENSIVDMPKFDSVSKFEGSKFDCNWIPLLHTIDHYPNLKEIIVVVTPTEKGSFGQTIRFKRLVDKYFEGSREINIISHHNTDYLKSNHLKSLNENGAPIKDAKAFAQTILEIIDNIEKQNSNIKDVRKTIAVDVTGGTALMSAIMTAVTCSKDIFIHYTDAFNKDGMKSFEIDISSD